MDLNHATLPSTDLDAHPYAMKAITYRRYGPPEVLELSELAKPVPADGELLIRVCSATVSSADWRLRSLAMPRGFRPFGRLALGIRRPRQPTLGGDLAGVVESVGKDVKAFRAGDSVFAYTGSRLGCHAEYRCISASGPVAHKPTRLNFDQAAALGFGGSTMLDFFRRASLQQGEHVLVNGASGAVGSAAVQLAKYFGAHVTAVCSTANFELALFFGADQVMDYRKDEVFAQSERYDVIVDAAGSAPFARSGRSLKRHGRLLLVLTDLVGILTAPWIGLSTSKKVIAGPAAERIAYVRQLRDIADRDGFTPYVERSYALEDFRAAHTHVETGRKRGNVTLRIGDTA